MFKKIMGVFSRFRKKHTKKDSPQSYAKFEDFLFFVDEDNELYPFVSTAVEYCRDALKITRQRALLSKKIKQYSAVLEEVKGYESLSEKEADYFKELVNKLLSVTREKNELKFRICDFDNSLNRLVTLENDAENAVEIMAESEIKQRATAEEIERLSDAKDNLEDEKENIHFALAFLHRTSVVTAVVFSAVVFILVFMAVFKEVNIFFPLTILCFCLMFFMTAVYIFRRHAVYELKRNSKQQTMIVDVLNKKLVVYAYYHNFLDFEYRKYGVTSSAGLRMNLKNYDNYKHTAKKYDSIKNINYQTQKLLENFMRDKNIKDTSSSLEKFAKTINIDDKIEYAREIAEKKDTAERKMAELDKKHEIIWEELVKLNLSDKSSDKVIEKIINAYLQEAATVFSPDNDEETAEIDEKNI